MSFRNLFIAALCAWLVPLALRAQDQSSSEGRRWVVGGRLETFPSSLFTTTTAQSSTTNPIADYSYSATSSSPQLSFGPDFEYQITKHVSAAAEFRFHHAQYQQITTMLSGLPDPNSATDNRKPSTFTETTKANYYEIPVLAHYYFLHPEPLARLYVTAGVEYRHVGRVRTGNEFAYADGSDDYNEIPATPVRTNQLGFVGGFGFVLSPGFISK